MNDSFIEKDRKYRSLFGESFPTFQVACARSDSEVMKIMDRCIQEGKDAYELGYAEENEEMVY